MSRTDTESSNYGVVDLVSSEPFTQMSPKLQEVALNQVADERKNESGIMGKLIGTKKANMALNITLLVCAGLFILMLIDIVRALIMKESAYTDLVKACIPILSLAIGYAFGQIT